MRVQALTAACGTPPRNPVIAFKLTTQVR